MPKPVCFLTLAMLASAATLHAQSVPYPVGITNHEPIYYPNQNADTLTGMKAGWSVPGATVDPVYGMWQNAEHGLVQIGNSHILLLAMETNRNYQRFVEAINFLEYPIDMTTNPTTPNFESGYWRGNSIDSHIHIWAPDCIEHEGTYYLFYPAPPPGGIAADDLSCYLATSTTGAADPAAWVQYDPDPNTPEIEPLFTSPTNTATGYRDFNIVKVNTPEGLRFYNYYCADPFDEDEGLFVNEIRLRISDSLTEWPDSGELPEPVFSRINVGETLPDRYFVDYENPAVEMTEDGFYLFVSRHGQIPADQPTNPDWEPIPLSTEVYFSEDGLFFDTADQLPNLKTADGLEVNSAEILYQDGRWFATNSLVSDDINNYPFDCCSEGNHTEHSEVLQRLVSSYRGEEDSIFIFEFEFRLPMAVGTNAWLMYQ